MNKILFVVFVSLMMGVFRSTVADQYCIGERKVFVNDLLEIDLLNVAGRDTGDECYWTFTTTPDRILLFAADDLRGLLKYIEIYDESGTALGDLLSIENQIVLEKSRKDLPPSIYTTFNSAVVRINYAKMLAESKSISSTIDSLIKSPFKLKISKAVNCPFNLGTETSCGRVVDAESCYCAVFTKRPWQNQQDFCLSKEFKLVSLESWEEEKSIQLAFGTDATMWISLNDIASDGTYVWNSTGQGLYPWQEGIGYANWARTQPDSGAEDCIGMDYSKEKGWNDFNCTFIYDAMCESQP